MRGMRRYVYATFPISDFISACTAGFLNRDIWFPDLEGLGWGGSNTVIGRKCWKICLALPPSPKTRPFLNLEMHLLGQKKSSGTCSRKIAFCLPNYTPSPLLLPHPPQNHSFLLTPLSLSLSPSTTTSATSSQCTSNKPPSAAVNPTSRPAPASTTTSRPPAPTLSTLCHSQTGSSINIVRLLSGMNALSCLILRERVLRFALVDVRLRGARRVRGVPEYPL